MPCPLFLPDASLRRALEDFHRGCCSARPERTIPDEMLRACCNRGYARAQCPEAAQIEADATSFMVKAIAPHGAEVAWSLERNHHPVEVGRFWILRAAIGDEGALLRQARAYASPCL